VTAATGMCCLPGSPSSARTGSTSAIGDGSPGGAIDARLCLPDGGRLRCIATHLGLSAAERRAQFAGLRSTLTRDWGIPLVLMGDFNQWLPFWGGVRSLDRLLGSAPWRATFPARFPFLSIDRIWVYPPHLLIDLRALAIPGTPGVGPPPLARAPPSSVARRLPLRPFLLKQPHDLIRLARALR
jgi:hypothetical protein